MTAIDSAVAGFRKIILGGVPKLLNENDTRFLAFMAMMAAIDALAGYRYDIDGQGAVKKRFTSLIVDYFPSHYAPHADNLYLLRCRILHNFTPAYFTLDHDKPQDHLKPNATDTTLSDKSLFEDLRNAAEKFFAEVASIPQRHADMQKRLDNLGAGGAIYANWT